MPGEARRQRLRVLLKAAGAAKPDVALFEEAFAHTSAVREKLAERSNERLEFFGDAILGFIVVRSLFERFPEASEGELTLRKHGLVADLALAETADRLGFDALVVLGSGLANAPATRRRSLLADAFEAFVATLYRTNGIEVAARFVEREHIAHVEALGAPLDDPKTMLQEWSQKLFGRTPNYEDRHEGPDHERAFFADVTIGEIRATGSGVSKKAAQRAAAAAALGLISERERVLASEGRGTA